MIRLGDDMNHTYFLALVMGCSLVVGLLWTYSKYQNTLRHIDKFKHDEMRWKERLTALQEKLETHKSRQMSLNAEDSDLESQEVDQSTLEKKVRSIETANDLEDFIFRK